MIEELKTPEQLTAQIEHAVSVHNEMLVYALRIGLGSTIIYFGMLWLVPTRFQDIHIILFLSWLGLMAIACGTILWCKEVRAEIDLMIQDLLATREKLCDELFGNKCG